MPAPHPAPTAEPAPGGPTARHELAGDPSSRKRFLRALGGTGAAGAFSALLAACGGSQQPAQRTGPAVVEPKPTDSDIVNFALTLEYLEADFYERVAASGLVSGRAAEVVEVVRQHERDHVRRLTSVAKNLTTGNAAKPVRRPKTRFPLESQDQILRLASTFENLGAAAYIGQISNIRDKELLSEAASIATVEARHAAELNKLVGKSPTPSGAFEKPMDMAQVLAKAAPYLVS